MTIEPLHPLSKSKLLKSLLRNHAMVMVRGTQWLNEWLRFRLVRMRVRFNIKTVVILL